jgi:hypothetical protein
MATKTKSGAKGGASASPTSLERLRAEAQRLIAQNSGDLRKNLERLQRQLQTTAERTVRDLERRLLKRLHAANEAQVKDLQQRVARLEKALARKGAGTGSSGEKAA